MTDTSSERQHLLELKATVNQRRRWLEKQLAHYNIAEAPTNLLMQLDNTKEEIEQIDIKLIQLGEDIFLFNSHDLLERIKYLEEELTKMRRYISTQSKLKTLSWGYQWYSVTENSFTIYGKNGQNKEYIFNNQNKDKDIEKEYFPLAHTTSLDGLFFAIVISNGTISFMSRIYQKEHTYRTDKSQLFVFKYGDINPIIVTDIESMYAHGLPAFSSDNTMIAFAFSHNWREKEWIPNPGEEPIGLVEWDETVQLININTHQSKNLITEITDGYGRWAHTLNFHDLTFIQFDEVLFGVTSSEAGIVKSWYIPVNGGQVETIYNPFLGGDPSIA